MNLHRGIRYFSQSFRIQIINQRVLYVRKYLSDSFRALNHRGGVYPPRSRNTFVLRAFQALARPKISYFYAPFNLKQKRRSSYRLAIRVTFALLTTIGSFALQLTRGPRLSDRAFSRRSIRAGPSRVPTAAPLIFGSRGDWSPRETCAKGVVPRLVVFMFAHASYHYEQAEQSRRKNAEATGVLCRTFGDADSQSCSVSCGCSNTMATHAWRLQSSRAIQRRLCTTPKRQHSERLLYSPRGALACVQSASLVEWI